MSYMWKVIRLPDGQYAQLTPYDVKCSCLYNCKSKLRPIQYCGKDCQMGNCKHAVQMLGQNVGRPMCACGNCQCDQAAYTGFSKCDACYNGHHAPH